MSTTGPGVGSPTNPLDHKNPVMLTRGAVNRIGDAVHWVERETRGGRARPRRQINGEGRWTAKFLTGSSGIGVSSTTAHPNHATCSFCDFIASAGSWSVTSLTDQVYNPSTAAAVTANAYITALYVSGIWEAVTDPC